MGSSINSASTFLVSGGAKGITAQCVIRMAQHYGCGFVLLGRTPESFTEPEWAHEYHDEAELMAQFVAHLPAGAERPTPAVLQQQAARILAHRQVKETLEAIRRAGGRAEYLSVDITDADAVRTVLHSALLRLPKIDGLIHGAGVLADKLIAKKSMADFELVTRTKIDGLRNLLANLPLEQLRYIVLFSSIAGFYGNVGQTDYALANAVLDKAAHQLQRLYPSCRVIALNWGPWDSGMVSPELRELFIEHEFTVISGEQGTQALIDELEREQPATQTLIGDPIQFATEHLSPVLRMIRARRALMGGRYDQLNSDLRSYEIRRVLTLAANPFLNDHRINGNAVLPITCAVAWMTNACEQLYPGLQCVLCEQVTVLKGIVFDEQLADHYLLSLRELHKTVDPAEVVFEAQISSTTSNGQPRYHYRARLTLRKEPLPAEFVPTLANAQQQSIDAASFYHDGTLFHGPSFQGVERLLHQDAQGNTVRCRLAALTPEQQGQFTVQTLNPYVADACLHGVLIWMRQREPHLVLPLGFQRIEHHKVLAFDTPYFATLHVESATATQLISNLTIADEHGRIHLRIMGLEGAVLRSAV